MTSPSRILVPVEFSPRCRGAARFAEALACHFHSEIILLHVVTPSLASYGYPEALAYTSAVDLTEERLAERKPLLEGFLGEELKNMRVARVLVTGDPAREIVGYAARENCDLIVLPTHGYGPFRRLLLGSVTAKVLHDAPCPVWTGPHLEAAPAYESISFAKVLCAIDLGPESPEVLRWAAGFAQSFGGELAIVHALPMSTVRMDGMYFDPEWSAQACENARNQVSALKDKLQIDGKVIIETGDVPDTVSASAEEYGANLLVIGRGHRTGVLGRLRTNAYAILRESPCPVAAI